MTTYSFLGYIQAVMFHQSNPPSRVYKECRKECMYACFLLYFQIHYPEFQSQNKPRTQEQMDP